VNSQRGGGRGCEAKARKAAANRRPTAISRGCGQGLRVAAEEGGGREGAAAGGVRADDRARWVLSVLAGRRTQETKAVKPRARRAN
jgi:hypothetical protein